MKVKNTTGLRDKVFNATNYIIKNLCVDAPQHLIEEKAYESIISYVAEVICGQFKKETKESIRKYMMANREVIIKRIEYNSAKRMMTKEEVRNRVIATISGIDVSVGDMFMAEHYEKTEFGKKLTKRVQEQVEFDGYLSDAFDPGTYRLSGLEQLKTLRDVISYYAEDYSLEAHDAFFRLNLAIKTGLGWWDTFDVYLSDFASALRQIENHILCVPTYAPARVGAIMLWELNDDEEEL